MFTRTTYTLLVAGGALPSVSGIHIVDRSAPFPHIQSVEAFSFSDFVAKFNRSYVQGTDEWARREAVFGQKKEDVLKFLNGPPQSWIMGITQFADYTEPEYKAILGYKGRRDSKTPDGAAFASKRKWTHPPSFSTHGDGRKLSEVVRDQGACGSCWAEAATASLESQMEGNATIMKHLREVLDRLGKNTQAATLSSQAMVSCTKNPRNCGGTGGCDGATVELAYDMVKEKGGLPLAIEWPYESGFGGGTPTCKEEVFKKVSMAITGYEVLPSNKLHPLMQALYESGGAIAVSVDASYWSMYSGGIYSDVGVGRTGGDFTVNHAVTLVAYKTPQRKNGKLEQGYWYIKNSWGSDWGEDGYIRLELKENEEDHCGMDKDTHKGLACDGDPDTAWVCGTCGVLYDSVYATGLHLV